jgi:pterin-4a-carbinolamine dehydratase
LHSAKAVPEPPLRNQSSMVETVAFVAEKSMHHPPRAATDNSVSR